MNTYGWDAYDWTSSPDFMAVIGMILITFLIISIVWLLFWIFRCIALYALAKNRGMSGAGLAWIPFIGQYRMGSIADDISRTEGSKSVFGIVLLLGTIISRVLSSVSTSMMWPSMSGIFSYSDIDFGPGLTVGTALSSLGGLLGLSLYVIQIIALNKIYKSYRPESSTAWTVLSAIPFTHFLVPIFLFIIRNQEPRAQWNMSGPPIGYGAPGGYQHGYPPGSYPPGGYAPPPDYGAPQQGYPGHPQPPYYPQPPQYPQPPYPQQQPPQTAQPIYQPPAAPQPPQTDDPDTPDVPDVPRDNDGDNNFS